MGKVNDYYWCQENIVFLKSFCLFADYKFFPQYYLQIANATFYVTTKKAPLSLISTHRMHN